MIVSYLDIQVISMGYKRTRYFRAKFMHFCAASDCNYISVIVSCLKFFNIKQNRSLKSYSLIATCNQKWSRCYPVCGFSANTFLR